MAIYIFRPGSFGDLIVALPLIASLKMRHANEKIFLISETGPETKVISTKQFYDFSIDLDGFYEFSTVSSPFKRVVEFRKMLKITKRDLIVYAPYKKNSSLSILRDLIFFILIGFRKSSGFKSAFSDAILYSDSNLLESTVPEYIRLLRCGGFSLLDLDLKSKIRVLLDNQLENSILEKLESNKILIAVAPFSKIQAKNWGVNNFINYINKLSEKVDSEIFLVGGKDDHLSLEYIAKKINIKATILSDYDLPKIGYILSRCSLFVGNDSGPLHLAALLTKNSIGIFSDRDRFANWEPFGVSKIFRDQIKCGGCMLNFCYAQPSACLNSISVDMLIDQSLEYVI